MNSHRQSANLISLAIGMAFLAFTTGGSAQQFFTDRAAFLANVQPGYYEEKFDGWSAGDPLDGHQTEWEAPGANGFGLTVSAPGSGNHQLYSLSGALSTSSYNDALAFQVSGNPVYAFGGDFWGTQYDGTPQATEVQFETDNGVFSHMVSGPSFIGFISNVPLTNIWITTSGATPAWPTADNIIVGELKHDGDLDGDGMTNYDELLAGTDPGDPKSNFRIISIALADSGLVITFSAVARKTYRLEYKDALSDADWLAAPVSDFAASVTGPAQFSDPSAVPPRFYRILLVQQQTTPAPR